MESNTQKWFKLRSRPSGISAPVAYKDFNGEVSYSHLYIISEDDLIKPGELFVNYNGDIKQNNFKTIEHGQKIIACTDKSIRLLNFNILGISQEIINKFIEEKNEHTILYDIKLFVEEYTLDNSTAEFPKTYHRPIIKYGEVVMGTYVKKIQQQFTLDEVTKLCKRAWEESDTSILINECCGQVDTAEYHIDKSFDNWLIENKLKAK